MKVIRNFFDNQKPNFSPGGKREKYFPLYDVFENLFFLSKNKTTNPIHVRDAIASKELWQLFGYLHFLLCFLVCIT